MKHASPYKIGIGLLAIGTLTLSACHKELVDYIQPRTVVAGQYIASDTLSGSVKGTLQAGRTYYFDSDLTINDGDTLFMQPGSRLLSLGDGSAGNSPQITCFGTFISIGTRDSNNYITVPDNLRKASNAGKGYWGGIQCREESGDIVLKWTHLEFAGGVAGDDADPNVFAPTDTRNSLSYTNPDGNVIIEDCWIYGTEDDGVRILHGHVSIMRNTFEDCGTQGGEGLNIKNNTTGDVAYNLIIGAATNAFKISNSGGGPETDIFLYNNTMLNCGFRQLKGGRGGSIDYEKGARGKIYNNMIINCRYGLRIVSSADVQNTTYNNQFYYGNAQYLLDDFADQDGDPSSLQLRGSDVYAKAPGGNNPMFVSYNVDQFEYTTADPPIAPADMPFGIVTAEGYDFDLQNSSPAIGKGDVSSQPMKTVPQGGELGATTIAPNKDMGAYPGDGSGNRHLASSLDSK